MAEEEQKTADMSQESIDYDNKREFRSDQTEGRLSLNTTLQSEYGSEGGQLSEESSEHARKRSRSRLSKWNKRTGAQIYHMTENVGDRGRDVMKRVKRSVSRPRSMPVDHVDTEDCAPAEENNVMNISIEGSVSSQKKKSGFKEWDKKTGKKMHRFTSNIGERMRRSVSRSRAPSCEPRPSNWENNDDGSAKEEVVDLNVSVDSSVGKKKKSGFKQWDKRTGAKVHHMAENIGERGRSAVRSLSRSREPSSDPTSKIESDDTSAKDGVNLNVSVDESVERKKKKSGFKEWDKRTGAKIYHMSENITEKSRNAVRSLSKSREPSPGCSTTKDTESVSATDELEYNVPFDGSVDTVDRKKKKSGFKEWDKRTGAAIHNMTESVGDRGRDVVKIVSKNISRPASVPTDMDANKDDKISTISKASETSQERKKKSKFTEWNKRSGAQVHNITGTATDGVRSGITTAVIVTRPAVDKVRSGITAAANNPAFQNLNQRTGAQVHHITETATGGVRSGITTAVIATRPAVNKVKSGITAAANSPAAEAATERGRVLVRQATATLKRRTESMPRGASGPGADGNLDYSSTLPRNRRGSSSPSRGGTLKRLSANLPPLPPQLRKVFPGREPVHPRDPSPSKPSRRQGPVGRTWVKVYDDISYVDDKNIKNEQDYPHLAHTMGPTVLTNAKPMPTPPTPPPPRARHMDKPAQDLVVDNEVASLYLDGQIETNGRGRNNNRFKGKREKRTGTPLGREFDDEGDALRHSARLDAPQGEDEDDYIIPETLKPEKPIRGIKVYEDVMFKRKQQDQDKQIQQEAPQQHSIVADEIKIEEPMKPVRGVKVYEGIIFQRQQEKSRRESKVSQEMEEEKQPEVISKDSEEVLPSVQKPQRGIKLYEGIIFKQQQETEKQIQEEKKSEEIVNEVSAVEDKPSKPQRGIKIYDNIEFKKTQYTFETNIDESVSEVTVDESSTSSEVTVVDGSLKEDVPYKPVRGNKIYASLLVKTHEPSGQVLISEVKETYRDEPKLETKSVPRKLTEPVAPRLDELNLELMNSHLSLFEAPTLGVARMDIVKPGEAPVVAAPKPVVEAQKVDNSIPVTPKVEADPKLEEKNKPKEKVEDKVKVTTKVEEVRKVEVVNKAGEAPVVEVTTKVIDTADISEQFISNISEKITAEISEQISKTTVVETELSKPDVNVDILDASIPPYARVHKDTMGVGPLRSLTPVSGDEDGPAPPIPPKLVGIRTITPTASFDIPPRPDRHLKPTHMKPARGEKKSRRPQVNGELLPSRPQRGTKIYADVEPAKPKRHSKIIRIEDMALMKEGLQGVAPPRRRRRSNQENEMEYEDVPEAVTARLTVALDHPAPLEISTDFYENVELKENSPLLNDRSRMRGRPPPPPPPKKGKILLKSLDRQSDQDSQPSGLSLGGNGEVGIPGVVSQGGSSSVDSSIPPPADVGGCVAGTTTGLTTTSQLETDIDHNLKNIESSFATLDDVLQSLKSYSRESSRNRRVILGESEKERVKLELEVNKRLEAIHSADVVGAQYQNVDAKSSEVNVVSTSSDPILVKKASVSVNDYTEEKSQLIQLPDKKEVKAESKGVQITETGGIKVAVTVSENQLLEKSKNVQSEVYLSQKAVVKEGTSEVKVAVNVEETQTSEKTQLLQKSNNIKSDAFIPKTAVAKEVKDEVTSEVKVAVSVEETQTSERSSEVQCDIIKARAELKDVKDEETEEVKVAVTVQECQLQEKTSEVSSEIVKAYAEIKDVKDEETEEVKVAVTVVELQTQEQTSKVKSGEILKEKAILKEEEITEEGPVLITEICSVVTPPKAVHEPVPEITLSLSDLIAEDKNVASVEEVTSTFELIKITVSGEESKQVEDSVTVQTSSNEVKSRAETAKTVSKASEEPPEEDSNETILLQAGVADIASRLEGIRCALESVIVNYPPPSPTPSTPPPSTLSLNTSTNSPVPPPPHSTPIQSPATPSIDTVHTTTDTINTNLHVRANTSLCPSSPTFPRASSPHTTTSYIPYIHSIAASIQSTAGSLPYEGYESPVSSPEPPQSPASPVIYHSSSAHALEALDISFKTFNDALEALEDPSLINDDPPSTDTYKPPSILHLLSPSSSKASVTTVQSSDKHPNPTDKIQESLISKSEAAGKISKFLTETSITDRLMSELQVQQSHIKDSSVTTTSDQTTQEISPQITLSRQPLVQQLPVETSLLEKLPSLQTSVEKSITASVQTQQTQVESSPSTQSIVEPSKTQSLIDQTFLGSPQTQQTSVQDLPTTQSPTLKKSPSTSRFGLTVSPSSDNLLPWEYIGPANPPSPVETPRGRSPLLSPKAPAPRSKSPVFGFTKVDPDSDNIPWQYLGPVKSSSILPDPKPPSSSHDSLQSSSISAVVTSSISSSITESKSLVESFSSIPTPSRDTPSAAVRTLFSPFPSSPPKPTARFTFGLPSVVPSGNPTSCTSNIQDLQSATGQPKDASSTTLEESSTASASQQNQTGGCVELTLDSNSTSCSDPSFTLPTPEFSFM